MTAATSPALVLFDFDDVLVGYVHDDRVAHLARTCGCSDRRVAEVLFESGLETEYDGGDIDTATYLARLGEGLGSPVDEAAWIASRLAGSRVDPAVLSLVQAVAGRAGIGVLTNNGALVADVARQLLPSLSARLEGRVLCSGALRTRKPDAAIFVRALDRLGASAGDTLFLDDKAANVAGARAAGLRAECVPDREALAAALRAHGFEA